METASKNEEISETGTTSDEFRVVQIPDPRCEKFPPQHFLTDVVVRKIRDCLWSSPSDPPPILTPSCLCYIRKKSDLLEDVIEKLIPKEKLQAKTCSLICQLIHLKNY